MSDLITQDNQMQIIDMSPSGLLLAAIQQNADIDKLEKLMALKERYEANEARKSFIFAMAEFKRHAPKIEKDKFVGYENKDGSKTGYKHATLGNVCNQIVSALANFGFSHNWIPDQQPNGMVGITCVITHCDGHSESTRLECPPDNSGKKNGIQQMASAVSYLQRYTLLSAVGLSTVDATEDDDGQGAMPVDHDALIRLDKLISAALETKTDTEALQFWKANNGQLAKNPVTHARLKEAIANHRADLAERLKNPIDSIEKPEEINPSPAPVENQS